MKRILCAILCGLMLLSVAACGGGEKPGDTMTAEEILNTLYEGASEDELPMGLMSMQAEGEMVEYFLFVPVKRKQNFLSAHIFRDSISQSLNGLNLT